MDDFQDVADRLYREYGDSEEFIRQLRRELAERTRFAESPPQAKPSTIHFTELPEFNSCDPVAVAWNFYRREVGRLLAEGKEGKWVLIKGEEIIGLWDTLEEAHKFKWDNFPYQPLLLRQVLTREPPFRAPIWWYRCPS
jgi:hypothetical protein